MSTFQPSPTIWQLCWIWLSKRISFITNAKLILTWNIIWSSINHFTFQCSFKIYIQCWRTFWCKENYSYFVRIILLIQSRYGPRLVIMDGFMWLSHLSLLPVPDRIPDIAWFEYPLGLIKTKWYQILWHFCLKTRHLKFSFVSLGYVQFTLWALFPNKLLVHLHLPNHYQKYISNLKYFPISSLLFLDLLDMLFCLLSIGLLLNLHFLRMMQIIFDVYILYQN